jgi:uncharacterized Zn ribbon protein
MLKINENIPKCPKCGSKNILGKKSTNTMWCRKCLHEWSVTAEKA